MVHGSQPAVEDPALPQVFADRQSRTIATYSQIQMLNVDPLGQAIMRSE